LINPVQFGCALPTAPTAEDIDGYQTLNMFSPHDDQQFTVDLDFVEELLASMNVKRPADDTPTYYKKMPHKELRLIPTDQVTMHRRGGRQMRLLRHRQWK